jgi:hypothetical protein
MRKHFTCNGLIVYFNDLIANLHTGFITWPSAVHVQYERCQKNIEFNPDAFKIADQVFTYCL